ncbi:MAG: hypothetical protein IKV96_03635, partial [Firmicutes bacterium]|nr:hypothetical protein [Bacillota bacterium]
KEKIYKNLENDFSLLLATESLNPDISKTYQVNGDMTVCMHANAGDLSQDADVTMKTSGLLKGSQSLLDVNMTIESGAEKVGTTGKLRADADAGISEIQLEGITPEGQWQDAATAVVGGISGLDSVFDMAVTGNSDMTAVLDEFISVSEDDYTIDTYDQLVASYEVAKRVFGDQAFEKNGNTYTANFDSTSFASAEELSSALVDMGITGNITIKKDSNGKVSGADMNIKMYLDDPLAMFELVMTQSSRADGGSINMSLNGGGMELKIQSQATRKNTNQTFVWG